MIASFLASLLRVVFAFLASLSVAYAEEDQPARQVWLNPGFFSWHFDRDQNLRGDNWGVGVEVALTPEHGVMAGTFINSDNEQSRYATYLWRPLHWQPYGINVRAGVALGVVDGYPHYNNGGWFIGLFPLLAVEGKHVGANFSIVPTINNRTQGAVVFQIKFRVW